MSAFDVKASQGNVSEIPPAGAHPAVVVAVVDLGTHREVYKDDKKGEREALVRKVFICWELTAERCAGFNRNHVIGREYTLTFSPKSKLRQMLEGWRGKKFNPDEAFNLGKILGQPCLATVTHGKSNAENTYAKLDSVAPVPKGLQVPKPGLTPFLWEIGQGEFPNQTWLPYTFYNGERKPLKDVIEKSAEWRQLAGGAAADGNGAPKGELVSAGAGTDEIPF